MNSQQLYPNFDQYLSSKNQNNNPNQNYQGYVQLNHQQNNQSNLAMNSANLMGNQLHANNNNVMYHGAELNEG